MAVAQASAGTKPAWIGCESAKVEDVWNDDESEDATESRILIVVVLAATDCGSIEWTWTMRQG